MLLETESSLSPHTQRLSTIKNIQKEKEDKKEKHHLLVIVIPSTRFIMNLSMSSINYVICENHIVLRFWLLLFIKLIGFELND